jgi:peptidoglycan/LPS O-acetylase OafA/YrhL
MIRRYYRPELDALRAFAFMSVFCCHAPIEIHGFHTIAAAGMFGMCLFFMLSAYLIVNILLREKETSGTVHLKAFAVRRILRIWPLYFLVLFSAYFAGRIWPSIHIPGQAVLAFSFLMGNVYSVRHGFLPVITPLWSLSVEEQFYIAIPALARFGGRRALYTICVVTIAVSYATLIWLGMRGTIFAVGVWANSFVQFQFFAAGALIALISYNRRFTPHRFSRIALCFLCAVCWFSSIRFCHVASWVPSTPSQLVFGYLLALVGTTAIFMAVVDVKVHIPRSLVYLGKISYGLYLFHVAWLALVFDTFDQWHPMAYFTRHTTQGSLLALCGTIAMAAFSYHFFERPILKYKERFETIHTRAA